MFAEQIRRAVEAAPRLKLAQIGETMWKAWAAGHVSDAEAEELSGLIEARKALPAAPQPAARRVGSRPRSPASMERRRSWAASGRLPPALANRFTLGEQAALAVVAAEAGRRGDCRLAIDHIAALAGVGRSTVKNALRQAHALGLVHITERKITGFRNDTNVVTIVSPEWLSWLKLGRRRDEPIGVKTVTGTPTKVCIGVERGPALFQGQAAISVGDFSAEAKPGRRPTGAH